MQSWINQRKALTALTLLEPDVQTLTFCKLSQPKTHVIVCAK